MKFRAVVASSPSSPGRPALPAHVIGVVVQATAAARRKSSLLDAGTAIAHIIILVLLVKWKRAIYTKSVGDTVAASREHTHTHTHTHKGR